MTDDGQAQNLQKQLFFACKQQQLRGSKGACGGGRERGHDLPRFHI